MEATLDMRLNIPKSDFRFFKEPAAKMGWKTETKGGSRVMREPAPYPTLEIVREKMAALGVSESDVTEAVGWARKKN